MTGPAEGLTKIAHKTPPTPPLPPNPAKVKPEPGTTWSGPRPRRTRGISAIAVTLLALAAAPASAVTVTVPDDWPTIQQAIDSGADTVFIREGSYPEAPSAYRGVTLIGVGEGRPHLGGLAISNPYEWLSRNWSVTGIDFAGPVTIATFNVRARFINVALTDCGLGSGLQHVLNEDAYDINVLSLTRCRLAAASSAVTTDIVMQADTVDAGVDWYLSGVLRVTDSWFRGGPNVALYAHGEIIDGEIRSCLFEDYNTAIVAAGLDSHYPDGFLITSNTVRRMRGAAIIASFNSATLTHNTIIDCGEGFRITRSADLRLRDNTILRCGRFGLLLDQPEAFVAERNVVGHCGGSGIVIRGASQADFSFTNNTLVDNAGSGIELLDFSVADTAVFRSNLVAWNATYGLLIRGPQTSVVLGCNDWFGNVAGAVSGAEPGATDLALDPLFCDVANDDVRLYASSPLVDWPGCGPVGALGVGCDVTATLVRRFGAERVAGGVRIAWELSESSGSRLAWLERSDDDEQGPWTRPATEVTHEGRTVLELDHTASAERPHWYRLVASEAGVTRVLGAPIRVEALEGSSFRLALVGPSPSRGPVRIEFELGTQAAIELEVFDVQGRLVASPARGVWPAGRHAVEWSGLRDGGRPHSGIYLIRYRYPGGEARRRVIRTS